MPDEHIQIQTNLPRTGVSIGLFCGDAVLLVKRGKEPFMDHWAFPGGSQELGETLQAAASRELKEETDIDCDDLSFGFIHEPMVRSGNKVTAHFVLAVFHGELDRQEDPVAGDDAKEASWYPISDLGELKTTPAFGDRLADLLALRHHM